MIHIKNPFTQTTTALLLLSFSLISCIGIVIISKNSQSITSSAQQLASPSATNKAELKGTPVALDVKNLEKYLVVETALLGVTNNISLYFKDVNEDKTISIDPNRSWIPASTIKAYVAIEAFRQKQIGLINFDQLITIQKQNVVPTELETDEFPVLNQGVQVTIKQLVDAMIIQSDNTAYNTLLDILDRRNINITLRNLGITETVVGEKLNLDDGQLQTDLQVPGRQPNTTTVKDFAVLFDLLQRNQIVESDKILDIFKRQKINSMIPMFLPEHTTIAHKTGDWAPIYHDGGVVYKPNSPFILAVFSNSNDQSVIAKIAKVAYDQNVNAVGEDLPVKPVSGNKTSINSLHRYLAVVPETTVLGATTVPPSEYIVQPGETLQSIAEKFYGDSTKWQEITRRNFLQDSTPVTPGTKLYLPLLTQASNIATKFPTITAADLGIKTSDVTVTTNDAKDIKVAFITPNSILYPIKRFFEKRSLATTTSPSTKVDIYIELSQKRLSEAKALLSMGKTQDISQILAESEADLKAATDIISNRKDLSYKLSHVKQLTDLHYALFASQKITNTNTQSKQQVIDALYTFYKNNQKDIAPVVRSSIIANPTEQQPIIGTIVKVEPKNIQLKFDDGTTHNVPITSSTKSRDFHSDTLDATSSFTVGSKIAIVGAGTASSSAQSLFILKNIPKELPDKQNGTVLDVNPKNNTIEIQNIEGKREKIIINDSTLIKSKDTSVSVSGITPGSQVTIFGESQAVTPLSPTLSETLSPITTPLPTGVHIVVSTVSSYHQTSPTPQSPSSSSTPKTVIKATSITVIQNGTGANVKDDNGKTKTPPSLTSAPKQQSPNAETKQQIIPTPQTKK